MFGSLAPVPFIGLLASSSILMLASFVLAYRNFRQEDEQLDGNARLMIQLSILSIFSVLVFVFFVFFW